MILVRLHLNKLARELGSFVYRYGDEVQLHERIAEVLTGLQIGFVREYRIDEKNRFDFMLVDHRIVIEVKVDGSISPALRQVSKYCELEGVAGVLLVTTLRWGSTVLIPNAQCHTKPVGLVQLKRASF